MSSAGAASRATVPNSNARAEASRKNGARSRGPKTAEGKARSAQNALKHGLRAEKYVVLPQEDAAEFKALEAALVAELAPVGALQTVLARRVAVAMWRLARADRLETEVLEFRSYEGANLGLALMRDANGTRSVETLLRYRGAAMAEFLRALRTLKALQAEARAHATAGIETPARSRAVVPVAAAMPLDPCAAPGNQPNEPKSRRNPGEPGRSGGRSNPGSASRVSDGSPHPHLAPAATAADPGRSDATRADRTRDPASGRRRAA